MVFHIYQPLEYVNYYDLTFWTYQFDGEVLNKNSDNVTIFIQVYTKNNVLNYI